MNSDIVKGKWLQIRGDIKKAWGKLTDDELDQANGQVDKLAGLVQERYGITREQFEKQMNDLVKRYES
ncbi:MAG: CsbD family protein [Chloroflexi bacterium HGW-Chloroflexi-10]|jgi:uncharacterized protein YjbJ (UPF0337 family)|nr:MAG: CsbD family protein [Chloroflexi bacterium HGW-Chloroflexi-10]